ncbi:Alpha/Beta hydrolase protein [Infundibulicybe gibba]|nr:Alpha/Beta hydrolase protein [Infundibulicybe gibba]
MRPRGVHVLTESQRRMYASEKFENFRWISKICASYSTRHLVEADVAADDITNELSELGCYAELAYSIIPHDFMIKHLAILTQPGFPLEGYTGLDGAITLSTFQGTVGKLPVYLAYRPSLKQMVIGISGTSSLKLALHDLRALPHQHPSRRGSVHSGFWSLYKGIKDQAFQAIRKGLVEHEVEELVVTGHSMGGSISYLLCIDLLSGNDFANASVRLKLAVFGTPRCGDAGLKMGGFVKEYSVKAYNDGVPALPPLFLRYRHFSKTPLYFALETECEYALFHVVVEEGREVHFPRGGHNYYNNRDLERSARRSAWLDRVGIAKEGWEERYKQLARNMASCAYQYSLS